MEVVICGHIGFCYDWSLTPFKLPSSIRPDNIEVMQCVNTTKQSVIATQRAFCWWLFFSTTLFVVQTQSSIPTINNKVERSGSKFKTMKHRQRRSVRTGQRCVWPETRHSTSVLGMSDHSLRRTLKLELSLLST